MRVPTEQMGASQRRGLARATGAGNGEEDSGDGEQTTAGINFQKCGIVQREIVDEARVEMRDDGERGRSGGEREAE